MTSGNGFKLFSQCLCGNESAFNELSKHASSSPKDKYSVGSKVSTHSLSSAQYNDLNGTISGAAVMKNGVLRYPIVLEITPDDKQIMALKPENLKVLGDTSAMSDIDSSSVFSFDQDNMKAMLLRGYYGLFALVNENSNLSTSDKAGRTSLLDFYTQKGIFSAEECPDFQYLLGECHEYGIEGVIPRDTQKAMEWFRLAAAQGHAGAQCELGYCYHNGEGVAQDYEEGVKFYSEAAEQGYAKAQYYLGLASYYGQGVETDTDDKEDYEAAVRLYSLAADQGYAPAQSNLGFCYQIGKGCNINIEKAEKYFKLAADQGDSYASAKLSSLKDFIRASSGV